MIQGGADVNVGAYYRMLLSSNQVAHEHKLIGMRLICRALIHVNQLTSASLCCSLPSALSPRRRACPLPHSQRTPTEVPHGAERRFTCAPDNMMRVIAIVASDTAHLCLWSREHLVLGSPLIFRRTLRTRSGPLRLNARQPVGTPGAWAVVAIYRDLVHWR